MNKDNKGHFIKSEVAPEVTPEPVEEPKETIVDKIEKKIEKVVKKDSRTQAQIDAGQTVEEAKLNPVEGAQIHNQ